MRIDKKKDALLEDYAIGMLKDLKGSAIKAGTW
jgi:hypothetical protein